MPNPSATVGKFHFEDFDGTTFERLVFAYHARTERWRTLEWYGQVGGDHGRDIWGVREDDTPKGETIGVLCANWRELTLQKATSDIDKLISAPTGLPDLVRVVTGSKVSAELRDKIKAHARTKGIQRCDVWSGTEFEEFLRRDCESLLRRFAEGIPFPDASEDLKMLARGMRAADDREALALISRVFDRPAFTTSFADESDLGAFKQAITDTIQALNTGIWQTRDGKEIGRIPSKHDLANPEYRSVLERIVEKLIILRSTFDGFVRAGKVRHCGCTVPDCSIYTLDREACETMDALREEILVTFRKICTVLNARSSRFQT